MGNRSKMPQTDWTRQGKEIADTAVPYWKSNLTQLNDYMQNIQNRYDPYLEYAMNGQAAQTSDLLREYQRAMGNMTANNYSATSGGYSSTGQRAYDDQQRYWNDQVARLYSEGLDWAASQAGDEWTMLTNTPKVWQNAYAMGQNYSNIDQYNQLVDEANSNWWSGAMDTLGNIGMAIPNPIAKGIGGALKLGAGLTSSDAGQLADSLRSTNIYAQQQAQMNNAGQSFSAGLNEVLGWGRDKYGWLGGNNSSNNVGSGAGFGNWTGNTGLGSYNTNWNANWLRN